MVVPREMRSGHLRNGIGQLFSVEFLGLGIDELVLFNFACVSRRVSMRYGGHMDGQEGA